MLCSVTPCTVDLLGHAEIGELEHREVTRQEEIGWFEITMHNDRVAVVEEVECLQ